MSARRACEPWLARAFGVEDVLALRLDESAPVAEPGLSLPELPRARQALPLRPIARRT